MDNYFTEFTWRASIQTYTQGRNQEGGVMPKFIVICICLALYIVMLPSMEQWQFVAASLGMLVAMPQILKLMKEQG